MALSVRFHPAAGAQLFDLYGYIAAETGRDRAGGFIDRIEASCLSLGTFPEMGREAEDLAPDLRLHPFERRAMIVYRDTPEAMEVLGVYTGAATWPPSQSRQRASSTPFSQLVAASGSRPLPCPAAPASVCLGRSRRPYCGGLKRYSPHEFRFAAAAGCC
jgi:toxin ParE1/3/4